MQVKKMLFMVMGCCLIFGGQTYGADKAKQADAPKQAQSKQVQSKQIVAVVNEDVVTATDLQKRMRLILASSGLPPTPEVQQKLAPQVLNGLIEEQLMLQEAAQLSLEVAPQEIEDGFATIAKQNNTSADQFKDMLRKAQIDLSTMERQIKAQVAWGKVVQARLRPKVSVSERDVSDALERIKAKIGTTEYLAAEIFLPVDGKAKEDQALQLAKKMVSEIKNGKASFFKLAQQFSKSPGSAKGGDMGWVQESQIAPEILSGLKKLQKNQVTEPIRSALGVHILFLRDSRTLAAATMPSRESVYYNLGTERLDRLQRRHLMDVKASSFIEIRV